MIFRSFLILSAASLMSSAISSAQADEAKDESWAVHGQSTFLDQYHPPFASAFTGPNSMDPGSRGDETFDLTVYAGTRPWEGGEAWANLEVDQGFGLSHTLGAAAFPSGEAYKVGAVLPYARLQRLFFRQTFDLGGDADTVAPAANQLGSTRTKDNFVVTAGKFSVTDVFDTNSYAHDPRADFMNWAIIDSGAYDYAADSWGYSYGVAGEWSMADWSVRTGLFDLSRVPNDTQLVRGFGQYELVSEVERRLTLFGQDGSVKLLGFYNRGNMGSYNAALALAAATHAVPNTALVRQPRTRPGGALNIAQGITGDLGVFLRASLNDGSQEAYEFTEINRSLAGGLSLKGNAWSRGDDTVGLAFESAAISRSAQAYLAAGGLGILIGDGRLLHYNNEDVMEAYYDFSVAKGLNATADYQLIINPAYNANRGPISVLGFRLHGEF
jgi:high affinity Mn2+ porin